MISATLPDDKSNHNDIHKFLVHVLGGTQSIILSKTTATEQFSVLRDREVRSELETGIVSRTGQQTPLWRIANMHSVWRQKGTLSQNQAQQRRLLSSHEPPPMAPVGLAISDGLPSDVGPQWSETQRVH